MKNLRELLAFNQPYYTINREERNYAAIFYHVLLINNNLEKFIREESDHPLIVEEAGIYFEYSFIRDLWSQINKMDRFKERDLAELNNFKKKVILDLLQPSDRVNIEKMSVLDFNKHFGAVRTMSTQHIASPGNWSIRYFHDHFSPEEFKKVCKFKWCFNAKPDIVIHTSNNTAICIEAKVESTEGQYPSSQTERAIFYKKIGRDSLVGQLEIQQKIMKMLGIDATFLYLVQNKEKKNEKVKVITWKEAFDSLDMGGCPHFIKEWVKKLDD
jgi:hypothetical protein